MLEDDLQRLVDRCDGHFQKSMNDEIENGQEAQADVAKVNRKDGRMRNGLVWEELLAVCVVESDMFLVPVALLPMIGLVVLDELTDATAEFVGFEQKQLNDVEADVRLFAFVCAEGLYSMD